mmetsp:Transcript_12739/g.45109  ORF Transcript_12739/g.45109 Transcript_12739/m.45109 type:complete len:264 (-) Transcript_12739:81-872(-)
MALGAPQEGRRWRGGRGRRVGSLLHLAAASGLAVAAIVAIVAVGLAGRPAFLGPAPAPGAPRSLNRCLRKASGPAGGAAAAGVVAEAEVSEAAPKATVFVCTSSSCTGDGAEGCLKLLRELAPEGVEIRETGCLGPCGSGPNILATPLLHEGVAGGKEVKARRVLHRDLDFAQPAGICFTGMKTEEEVALLAPWGFSDAGGTQGPLGGLKMLLRSSQLDQVPWPILLYVGFNVVRLIVSLLFHVDLMNVIRDTAVSLNGTPVA